MNYKENSSFNKRSFLNLRFLEAQRRHERPTETGWLLLFVLLKLQLVLPEH